MHWNLRKLITVGLAACVAAFPALAASPATASPAGPNGRIAFGRYDPNLGDLALYTINPDGSGERKVASLVVECPHWSPDGSRIATCGTPTFGSGATIIDPDTGSYREIPGPDPDLNTGCSVWSPDAKRLACESWSDSDPSRNGIYTLRTLDGQGLTQMTSNPNGNDVPMAYSPDGKRLVFARYNQDEDSLYVVKTDGTGLRQRIRTARGPGASGVWLRRPEFRPERGGLLRPALVTGRQTDRLRQRRRRPRPEHLHGQAGRHRTAPGDPRRREPVQRGSRLGHTSPQLGGACVPR